MQARTSVVLRLLLVLLSLLAMAGCRNGIRSDELDTLPVEDLYKAGSTTLENGNFDRAERYLKRLSARFPFGSYNEQAQLKLAYAQYRLDKYDEALATINRFIKTYPTHPHVDYAYYVRGLVNFDRNRGLLNTLIPGDDALRDQQTAKQSFLDFSELLKRYPNSKYAGDARQRMLYLRNNLATHDLAIAKYYLRRGAYVGALNRAKHIVETFQETPMAADALAIMVECYRVLDEAALAADTLEVLKLNAPNHPYLSGEVERKRSWLRRLWPFGRDEGERAAASDLRASEQPG